MEQRVKTYFNWSSGKDAALALYQLRHNQGIVVDKLVTTVNAYHRRVSMHGLRVELLKQQCASIGNDTQSVGFWFLDLIPM